MNRASRRVPWIEHMAFTMKLALAEYEREANAKRSKAARAVNGRNGARTG